MDTSMPRIGLGTWQHTDPEQCVESMGLALEMGYRHIDTAQSYDNEELVGRGIAESDVDREEVFLATKVSTSNLAYDDVLESTRESREKLGVDTIDLLYVHWPRRTYDPERTLTAFQELHDDGVIAHIGVSNFEPRHLDEAATVLDTPVFANQVEMHPLCPQHELVERAQRDGHWLVAYSPLARGAIFDHPDIAAVTEAEGITPAQVCLAWCLSKDRVAVIPKATGEAHLRENFEAGEIELSTESIERLDDIEKRDRQVNPSNAPWG